MPINKILDDGRVEIFNSKTGEIKQVSPEELSSYNPAMVEQYLKLKEEVEDPSEKLADIEAEETLNRIDEGGYTPGLTTDERKKELAKKEAARLIDQLEDSYFGDLENTKDDLSYGRGGGLIASAKAALGVNPELRTYKALRKSVRPTLARAAGDVGNLSEPEQKAAVKVLPTAFSTPEEAKMAFETLRRKMGVEERDIEQGTDYVGSGLIKSIFTKAFSGGESTRPNTGLNKYVQE